ncbi:gamma-mobile-trio protein GmtX [Duganella sp. CT11-25]|uniref:gamma-mobile-trio protein GmtX n=1 Tax=unclassified Duganella TaxID=2636909 RepID=UPI0039B094D2
MNSPHPDETYHGLAGLAKHPSKKKNLAELHRICGEQYKAGSLLFTFAHIERILVSEKVLSAKTLGNSKSGDYRTLILAWAAYARPPASPKACIDDDWLINIPDPAVRQLVQIMRSELNKTRGEVIVLRKLQKPIAVYMGTASVPGDQSNVAVFDATQQLLPTEKKSLLQAIDPNYLREHNLEIGKRGEIIQRDGVVLFERGFVDGLKRLLG